MNKSTRVVVTGMGLRSPIGNTMKEFSLGLKEGRRGIQRMPQWKKLANLRTAVAGVVHLGPDDTLPRKIARGMGRVALLAALAARDALQDSGLQEQEVAHDRCGVSFGSTAGSSDSMENFLRRVFGKQSLLGMQSSTYLQFMSHTCAANLAVMLGTKGPLVASCTACTSGSQGIGFAYEQILLGRADRMIAGGAEEMHFMDAGIFDIMRATSTKYNDSPDSTPRPFDADRDGLVVGEGAGCLILEEYESAKKRGARIWAEVLGFGTNCNGTHLTNSSPEGIQGAMERALADARLSPDRIQHVNAHATATETGDQAESIATNRLMGDKVPVSAIKGGMGHTLGASGALESIAEILMINEGFMASSLNLENPDPKCAPLNHIMDQPRDESFHIGMNNNFAFGGVNTSLIFGKA